MQELKTDCNNVKTEILWANYDWISSNTKWMLWRCIYVSFSNSKENKANELNTSFFNLEDVIGMIHNN